MPGQQVVELETIAHSVWVLLQQQLAVFISVLFNVTPFIVVVRELAVARYMFGLCASRARNVCERNSRLRVVQQQQHALAVGGTIKSENVKSIWPFETNPSRFTFPHIKIPDTAVCDGFYLGDIRIKISTHRK